MPRRRDAPVERTRLASGLRVVTEAMPELRSVTLGVWVGSGARDERTAEEGASHFLEHLLFKGTEARDARAIAEAVESVGGEVNAFTTHEQTVFYVRVPDSELPLACEILGDVVSRPAFRETDVEAERMVILDEIAMRADQPDDYVHDLFARALFPGHPLGREVIGSEGGIAAMPREVIAGYHAAHYRPENVVVAAAGNLAHEAVLGLVGAHLDVGAGARPPREQAVPAPARRLLVEEQDTEQTHVVVGMRALPQLDPDRYALGVVNQVLGGGMASRLFQEIREERGLAYSVYSYRAAFDDQGYLAVYAGSLPARVPETLACIGAELDRMASAGISDDEVAAAKGHLQGSLAMSWETSSSRMRRIGRAELVEGAVPSVDEVVARVAAVTPEDVGRVVERVIAAPRSLAALGPHTEQDFPAFT